jgi:RimJ/RimL family protein N-acetyltransferase
VYAGGRVRLRAAEATDAGWLAALLNDREVTRYLMPRYPTTVARQLQRIDEWGAPAFGQARFVIEDVENGTAVGMANLRDATPEDRDAEVDLLLAREFWGRGLGTEAMRLLVAFGIEQMGLHRIHLWVIAGNAAARAVYVKVGFVSEGVARQSFYKDGRWHDMELMALLADDATGA